MHAEAPRAYSFAIPSRIGLWQRVGDLRPLAVLPKKSGQRCHRLPGFFHPLPVAPVVLMEALGGRPSPVSSMG